MSMESDLFLLLQGVCPRVYPDVAPTDTPRPYVTWQQIGGDVINPLNNEPPGKRNASIQINVWSETRAEAISVINQIEDAMRVATAFLARPQAAAFNDYDHDMKRYGSQQEFSIWY